MWLIVLLTTVLTILTVIYLTRSIILRIMSENRLNVYSMTLLTLSKMQEKIMAKYMFIVCKVSLEVLLFV
jgi:hypothetical protein